MGQNYSNPNPQETTAEQLQSYIQYLPQLLNVTAQQTAPTAQQNLAAEQQTAPQEQALQSSIYNSSAPSLYNIGNALNEQTLSGGIGNALSNAQSAQGQQLAQTQQQMAEQANPQYYAALGQAGGQLSNLLGSIDVSKLTGSETAQVQRALAQQDAQKGITYSPSQTSAVSNAMQFGTALQAKQTNLANAINTATSFLPQAQTGVNTFNTATGATTAPTSNLSNAGSSQFLGVNGNQASNNASATNASLGSNLLNNITSSQNNSNQIQSQEGINSSIPSLMSSVPT